MIPDVVLCDANGVGVGPGLNDRIGDGFGVGFELVIRSGDCVGNGSSNCQRGSGGVSSFDGRGERRWSNFCVSILAASRLGVLLCPQVI